MNKKLYHALMALLREIIKFEQPSDKLLSIFFYHNKKLTTQERTLVADVVYTVLRNYHKLNALYQTNIPTIVAVVILHYLNYKPSYLSTISNIDIPTIINQEKVLNSTSNLELPQWIIDELQYEYTIDEIKAIAHGMNNTAPLDLRVNVTNITYNQVFNQLNNEGLNPQTMSYSPYGIRLFNKTFLSKHKLFLDGHIEVQDESSQIAGMLLNPKRGSMVVDFCAGAGGKTLLFGMLMRNSGRIYAFDINERRLNNLTPRLKRSGLTNVYPELINNEQDSKIKRLYNKIDHVFVDAPCSGLGTLRRNPDIKFRQTPESINELNQQQISILNNAAPLVKNNGYLVYATCSILKRENDDIVAKFIQDNPNFKVIDIKNIFKNQSLHNQSNYLKLLPHLHQTDGFFACLMQKTT